MNDSGDVSVPLDRLIEQVGRDEFDRAAHAAWSSAARTGRSSQARLDEETARRLFGVADDLAAAIWAFDAPESARVSLLADLYRRLPCSSVLFAIAVHYYAKMSVEGRGLLWERFRVLLDSADDRLADPIAYYLWAQFFEDPDRVLVEEVWRHLVDGQPQDRALRRVLEYSGPVPVDLKDELVSRVICDPAWHRSIFQALVDSRTAVYGKWEAGWAQAVFDRLREPQFPPGPVEAAIDSFIQAENEAALSEGRSLHRDVYPARLNAALDAAFSDIVARRRSGDEH